MDKVDLLAGAAFDKAIPKVLRESDLFIVCLSPNSVNKRSFIQREINLALDILEEKLGDDLYIFPVRLDECVAPDRIAKFNWTDLFGDEHEEEWEKLLRSLRHQAEKLEKVIIPVVKEIPVAPIQPKLSNDRKVTIGGDAQGTIITGNNNTIIINEPLKPQTELPKSFNLDLNGVPLEMILVPAGKFRMGSDRYDDEKPLHEVTMPSFYIGKFQITQKQWQSVMGNNPSRFKGDYLPVEAISWDNAQSFCEKLGAMTRKAFRLPSEAEWEYACRAGTTGDYAGNLDAMAWYKDNSDGKTHPVGLKRPNAFGLYDLHGNVLEWCEDVWHENYEGAPKDSSAWTYGSNQKRRVLRGGSCTSKAEECRATSRYNYASDYRINRIGFRCVISEDSVAL